MVDLLPDGLVELEHGVSVVSVGVNGWAGEGTLAPAARGPVRDAEPEALAELLTDQGVPEPGATLFGSAAEHAGLRRRLSVPLRDLVAAPGFGGGLRGDVEPSHLAVTVPAPEPDEGQALLEVDATGLMRWHFSVNPAETAEAAADSGKGGTDRSAYGAQTFRVPVTQLDLGAAAEERGVLAFGVRKVVHLIRFPLERAAGRVATAAVRTWEERHRPYGLHPASPAYFAGTAGDGRSASGGLAGQSGTGDPVTPDWFAARAGQPVLLLVHGTFSVGHGTFAGLGADADLLARWWSAYDGRVLAFDHPSVHVDPRDNARWLLSQLPDDRGVVLDVVAHSRGGLVARHLSAKDLADEAGRPAPMVRRLVHVATPNAGTVLASKQRLGDLLDVFTNLVSLFPGEGSVTIAATVLEVVKHVAVGVVGGLAGIAAMDPASAALAALNSAAADPATALHAITSDYDSAGARLPVRTRLPVQALDALVDRVFADHNDLVVPTGGVYAAGSYRVDRPYDLSGRVPSVEHNGFFADGDVRRQLDRWLLPD